MAWVEKRGKKYSVIYRVVDDLGIEYRKRVSGYATKEDAWAAAKQLEQATQAGVDVHGDKYTCGYWMERWFAESCLGRLEQTTISKYSDAMDILKETAIYDMPVNKLTKRSLPALIESIRTRDGKERSIRTARDNTEPLRFALSWAAEEGFIAINPIAKAPLPKTKKRAQVILNDDDVTELAAASLLNLRRSKNAPPQMGSFAAAVHLALYGGLRREEVAALTWQHVDFKRNTVSIVSAHTRATDGRRVEKGPKSHASRRTISMPKVAMAVLQAVSKHSTFVCARADGLPFELGSFAQAVGRMIDRINVQRRKENKPPMPKASFHDLRHTHAAYLIRLGVHAKVIQERLGHSSIKITMDTYGYLMQGLQETAANAIDAALAPPDSPSKVTA